MKKIVGLMIVGTLAGCAGGTYKPLVDFRASGADAQYYQRDLMECTAIVDDHVSKFNLGYHKAIDRCLTGRGHTVLSAY